MSQDLFSPGQINQLRSLLNQTFEEKFEQRGFNAKQKAELNVLLAQQGADIRREMLDMFDHFEKKFDKKLETKLDALETRLGTMIHEVVGHISPKLDDQEVRLRAVERTIKFA
jgi:hypothetical protein